MNAYMIDMILLGIVLLMRCFPSVAVVVAFFICWIPFHSQRLMFVVVTLYGEWTDTLQQVRLLQKY